MRLAPGTAPPPQNASAVMGKSAATNHSVSAQAAHCITPPTLAEADAPDVITVVHPNTAATASDAIS